jgi:hypothetical protein
LDFEQKKAQTQTDENQGKRQHGCIENFTTHSFFVSPRYDDFERLETLTCILYQRGDRAWQMVFAAS